jgi:hypothetical protein
MRTRLMSALLLLALPVAGQQTVDRVLARVGDVIITRSEVDELGRFQQLVDGRSQSASTRLRELIEQAIVAHEAALAGVSAPAPAKVEQVYRQLASRFGSAAAFARRLAELGLSDRQVRWYLQRSLLLDSFLEQRFRPEVVVTDSQIEQYYRQELLPELQRRGLPVPPLAQVEDQIREVLIQRAVNRRFAAWMAEMRAEVKIEWVGAAE